MVKEYIRKCDCCGKTIENMYEKGVTTLFHRIRVGRGNRYKDYDVGSILNDMEQITPKDYDLYGKGWHNEEDKEISFCSQDCVFKFFERLYK